MMITATEVTAETYEGFTTLSVTIAANKREFLVMTPSTAGSVTVICRNASHRVWRGAGRTFPSFEAAQEGYKSNAAKVAIDAARIALTA